jgi:hypothetical protein
MDGDKNWWFCLNHNTVEDDDGNCAGKDKLGPYPTKEAAEHALQTVQERNEEWDSQDR